MAASCALGSMAVGGLTDYLPFLLREISSQPRRQYLLLHSLKDVIRWLKDLFPARPPDVPDVALWRPLVAIKEWKKV